MPDEREMLEVLRYDSGWLRYGLIDQRSLAEQFSRFQKGVDENTEHYRYLSFCKLLERLTIDDVTLDRFIELAVLDEDQSMAAAALTNLVRHDGLTSRQLNHLKSLPAFASSQLQETIGQVELLRALDSSDLGDDLFNRCLFNGGDLIQRKLLNHGRISTEQLSTLAEHGVNRAIRNLAKQKLGISHQLRTEREQ